MASRTTGNHQLGSTNKLEPEAVEEGLVQSSYPECPAIDLVPRDACVRAGRSEQNAAELRYVASKQTGAPSRPAIDLAVSQIQKLGCATSVCVAVVRLHHIFDILSDGMETTMGAARCVNVNEPAIEEQHLHAVLLDHPDRFAPMCALLTGLASRYGKPGARANDDSEVYVEMTVVDLALRMDGHGPPSCLPTVLAALPQTAELDTAIDEEKTGCENEPVARNPCGRIVRRGKGTNR